MDGGRNIFEFSDISQSIHEQGFQTIRDVAFMLEPPSDGHLMSPLATVCLNLRVHTNFRKVTKY